MTNQGWVARMGYQEYNLVHLSCKHYVCDKSFHTFEHNIGVQENYTTSHDIIVSQLSLWSVYQCKLYVSGCVNNPIVVFRPSTSTHSSVTTDGELSLKM